MAKAPNTEPDTDKDAATGNAVTYADVVELGLFLIKTLITLNSGGVVVLMTFIGNAKAQTLFSVDAEGIKTALLLFVAGLLVAVGFATFAYVRSYLISAGQALPPKERSIVTTYVAMASLSVLCFAAGIVVLANSFAAAPAVVPPATTSPANP